eukprot:CAMPEP_0118972042 /NCGR_PEP_ID=MMETSP1173-20130426/8482_1 /TAXON_ID=1034831 /ORGANISM="Rhizochromulina marina cf, Strain CCMP1243" /LENGTH=55 /DNA_ID=CAMNT_0006921549 /DNA_START=76 /DNA_END=240 /DNA_ORIENTATION=-
MRMRPAASRRQATPRRARCGNTGVGIDGFNACLAEEEDAAWKAEVAAVVLVAAAA